VAPAIEQLPSGEAGRDPDDRAYFTEHISDAMHAPDVRQSLSMLRAGKNKVSILGHSKEAEIDLAEQRPALQQNPFAHALPEGPEDAGEIEILLNELRLHTLARSRFAAQISEKDTIRKPG